MQELEIMSTKYKYETIRELNGNLLKRFYAFPYLKSRRHTRAHKCELREHQPYIWPHDFILVSHMKLWDLKIEKFFEILFCELPAAELMGRFIGNIIGKI